MSTNQQPTPAIAVGETTKLATVSIAATADQFAVREYTSHRIVQSILLIAVAVFVLFVPWLPGEVTWRVGGVKVNDPAIVARLNKTLPYLCGLISAGLIGCAIYRLTSSPTLFAVDKQTNSCWYGRRRLGGLEQIASVQVHPDSKAARLSLLLTTSEAVPANGRYLFPKEDAETTGARLAGFLGVPIVRLEGSNGRQS